jgi:hypothetical protein
MMMTVCPGRSLVPLLAAFPFPGADRRPRLVLFAGRCHCHSRIIARYYLPAVPSVRVGVYISILTIPLFFHLSSHFLFKLLYPFG